MTFRPVLLLMAATAVPAVLPAAETKPASGKQNTQKARRAAKVTSMTGCVDEKDGRYVLAEVGTLRTVAVLEADSFPQEGFAKYLGKRVAVRGVLSPGTDLLLMKVRAVEKISDLCTSPQEPK